MFGSFRRLASWARSNQSESGESPAMRRRPHHRRARQHRFFRCVLLMAAALLLSACGPGNILSNIERGGGTPFAPQPAWTQTVQLGRTGDAENSAGNLPEPLWQRDYSGSIDAVLSGDGSLAVVYGNINAWTRFGFQVFNAENSLLWSQSYERLAAHTGTVVVHGGSAPRIIALIHDRNQRGVAEVFDVAGNILWSRPLAGTTIATVSRDGGRIAFIDRLSGRLNVTDGNGRELGAFKTGPNAEAAFLGDSHWLLVTDGRRVRLVGSGGQAVWDHEMQDGARRNVAVSNDTANIAVTTADRESAVYLFDSRGRLRWNQFLPLGGTNDLFFDPEGEMLYVYNIGDRSSIYAFDLADEGLRWRIQLEGRPDHKVKIRDLRRLGQERIIVHAVETADPDPDQSSDQRPRNHHSLLFIRGSEEPVPVIEQIGLGSHLQFILSRSGNAAAGIERRENSAPGFQFRYFEISDGNSAEGLGQP